MKLKYIILLIVLVLIDSCDSKQSIDNEIDTIENGLTKAFIKSTESFETYSIKERMEYYKIPGLSIAVVIKGKLRWAKGYGIANISTGSKVNENTLFQAASISKPISALGVLKLVEEGRLSLDENVNNYLSSWKLDENDMTDKTIPTLRLILSHNAGISVHGFAGYKQNERMPSLDQVLNGKGNSPKIMVSNKPGENAIYSGGGYTVVQKIIEDKTGESFEKFMKKSVLEPLSMHNSMFLHPLPPEIHASASAAYDNNGNLIEGLWHNYPELAAAGLWTTPSDLAKYMIEIMEIRHDKEDGILSRKMINDMLSLQGGGYHGLGPEVTDSDGTLEFGHLGKNAGFTNDMLGGVDTKNAIIIMTNGDSGGQIMSEIQRSICSFYDINLEIPETQVVEITSVSESYLLSLTGKYEFVVPETGERLKQFMELSIKDGKLSVLHESSGDLHLLEPLINNRFLDFGSGLLIEFDSADSNNSFIIEDWEAKLIKIDN